MTRDGEDSQELSETAREDLLEEARRIVDHQIEWARDVDEHMLRLLRINVVVLAAGLTLVATTDAVLDKVLGALLPAGFLAVGMAFWTISMVLGVGTFSSRIYGGPGDSPRIKMTRGPFDGLDSYEGNPERYLLDDPPEEYSKTVIEDYQWGILHNNRETRYLGVLHGRVVVLMVVAVVLLASAPVVAFTGSPVQIVTVAIATGLAVFGVVYTATSFVALLRFRSRNRDGGRMEYGHGPKTTILLTPVLERLRAISQQSGNGESDGT